MKISEMVRFRFTKKEIRSVSSYAEILIGLLSGKFINLPIKSEHIY
jgi:hypothetical protein